MKRMLVVSLLLGLCVSSPSLWADQALAQAKGCVACHQASAQTVGPSLQAMAEKYRDEPVANIAQKIKAGGSGVWGAIPMPPQPGLSDEEASALAAWVLSF